MNTKVCKTCLEGKDLVSLYKFNDFYLCEHLFQAEDNPPTTTDINEDPGITIWDRAQFYNRAFSKYPKLSYIHTPNEVGRIEGLWQIGNSYQGSGYYGSYPGNYLQRVMSLFPETHPTTILHLFSGSLKPGDYYRFDINTKNLSEFHGNAENLSGILPELWIWNLILADPPYSREHAKKYGFPMINRRKVLGECWKVLRPGGFLVWLDVKCPIYANVNWDLVGLIPVYCGTNRDMRAVFILQKK